MYILTQYFDLVAFAYDESIVVIFLRFVAVFSGPSFCFDKTIADV